MKTSIYSFFAVALLLTACNNETEEVMNLVNFPGDAHVRITTQLDAHLTKSGTATSYTGENLSLSVDYGAGNRFTDLNNKWTTSDLGASWIPNHQMLWKDAISTAKVYAFAPYVEGVTNISAVPFRVAADQNEGLLSSDLLTFRDLGFVPGSSLSVKSELNVAFDHALSKLVIRLNYGDQWGENIPNVTAVKINGTKLSTVLDATTGLLSEASGEVQSIVTRRTLLNDNADVAYEAIVVPQVVPLGAKLVSIELDNGEVYAYTITDASGLVFDSNVQYTIVLRVGKDRVDVSGVTKSNWGVTVDLGNPDSEIVPFSDPAFVAVLTAAPYNIPLTNGVIDPLDPDTKAAIEAVERLSLYKKNLKSVEGISYFKNLIWLDCSFNELSKLDVHGLTKLSSLSCYMNQLTSLDISALTDLTSLSCSYNKLTNLDLSALTKLTFLDFSHNQISSIDLSKLINLKSLNCTSNKLTSLDVTPLVNLTSLNCQAMSLTELDLSTLTKLESLLCSAGNKLTSLDVTPLVNLKALYCYGNNLSLLDISSLTKLEQIVCGVQRDANDKSQDLTLTLTQAQKERLSAEFEHDYNRGVLFSIVDL